MKENKIVVEFDCRFFNKNHVMLAAQDYTDSCWVLVDGSDDCTVVMIRPKKDEIDLKNIKDEFYNYVLATMKNN